MSLEVGSGLVVGSKVGAGRGACVGNAVGSNLFNIMFVLGISALVVPLDAKGIKSSDLYVMLAVTILLLPTVKTGLVIDRKEGLLFLGIYFGYIYYLWPL